MSGGTELQRLPDTPFLLVYLDSTGQVSLRASRSIADSCQTALSTTVIEGFLRAIEMSRKACSSNRKSAAITAKHLPTSQAPANTWVVAASSRNEGFVEQPASALRSWHSTKRRQPSICWRQCHTLKQKDLDADDGSKIPMNKGPFVPVQDQKAMVHYYERAFENLQQINCRTLAKAYVKLVEPRKQVNYPYNGRKAVGGRTVQLDPNATKPPWWPSQVSHREPDHLPKAERVRLLVHILRELRISHGITVEKLREADRPIRYQIHPPERVQFLDEIYHVREKEEEFLGGQTNRYIRARTSYPEFPENIGAASHTPEGEKRSSSSPVSSQERKPSFGEWEWDLTSDVPLARFMPGGSFPKFASSDYNLPCQSDMGPVQTNESQLSNSPDLIAPFSNPQLTWNCGSVEARSTVWSSPANRTQRPGLSDSTNDSSSMDIYSHAYPTWDADDALDWPFNDRSAGGASLCFSHPLGFIP